MASFEGPSWYDVAAHSQWMHERFHVSTEFKLVPPIRRLDGKGFSSWVAVAEVRSRGTGKGWSTAVQASYGAGGSWKNAPSALLQALLECTARLEAREKEAAAQAAF